MLEVAGVHLLPESARFIAFVAAGLALNIVPGADMAFVVASAARRGARGGIAAALGVGAGSLVHVAAAVVGLSALIASSQTAFAVLKVVGAAYLLYLAVQMLRGRGSPSSPNGPAAEGSVLAVARSGALVNVLNPKVAVFFMAFLPQFVDPTAEVPALQVLALGLWFILAGTLVLIGIGIAAAKVSAGVGRLGWVALAARWIGATTMGVLAVRLLITDRR